MNTIIKKPEPTEYAAYYAQYINRVPSEDLIKEMQIQLQSFAGFIENLPQEKMSYRYAEGKWTVAEIIQHLLDTERIYGYRMLNFVRKGLMEIPGFDQNGFAKNVDVSWRSKQSFINEFDAIRKSTIEFLKTITDEQSMIIGKANNVEISVRAIGYVAYGHIIHHCKVIEEKYL